jgi:hypothetical protein
MRQTISRAIRGHVLYAAPFRYERVRLLPKQDAFEMISRRVARLTRIEFMTERGTQGC